jgi:hypothetical protein
MNDREFAELQLKATICPGQFEWPKPEYTHWQKLHAAANEARQRVREAYSAMDEIDLRTDLSREDKNHERQRIAAQAIAEFEASRTLARASGAVRLLMDRDDLPPEIAEAARKAMKESEQGWERAIAKIAERSAQTKAPGGARRGALISGRI